MSGTRNLGIDNTNPTREEKEKMESNQAKVHLLCYDWGTDLDDASD